MKGRTIGAAFRHGINDGMVHWISENYGSAFRYSLDIEMLYGDPALSIEVPSPPLSEPAQQVWDGQTLSVLPPQEWTLVQYHPGQLAEWNYDGDLYMYTGSGASPKTYWSGNYDSEDMYFGVQLDLDVEPTEIVEQGTPPSPLGMDGNFYIDTHQDGSRTALWRVRLLDFDPLTGDILEDNVSFEYDVY